MLTLIKYHSYQAQKRRFHTDTNAFIISLPLLQSFRRKKKHLN
jgi:hypothetical protein